MTFREFLLLFCLEKSAVLGGCGFAQLEKFNLKALPPKKKLKASTNFLKVRNNQIL